MIENNEGHSLVLIIVLPAVIGSIVITIDLLGRENEVRRANDVILWHLELYFILHVSVYAMVHVMPNRLGEV